MAYMHCKRTSRLAAALCLTLSNLAAPLFGAANVKAAEPAPNIVVIFGDDIGMTNVSAYSHGLMGYRTNNIDRLAREGMLFTDYYGEQSSTAGRSAFITGQLISRTGLSKVGLPGDATGLQPEDATIAEALKSRGYATAQFGKNHLGDRDEHLPTNHGFDEFFGVLYAMNAYDELESPDYPTDPAFKKKYGPRGIIHSTAGGEIKEMEVPDSDRIAGIDDEAAERAAAWIEKQGADGKPFFTWVCFTKMHYKTHVKPESAGQAGPGRGFYADAMLDHDKNVGLILDTLDRLDLAKNTIVLYTSDNGPHMNTWPDAGMTPFRNEKNSNWEGAFRVPAMVRWPGRIKAGAVSNNVMSHLDWFPTLVAAAGEDRITEKMLAGFKAGEKNFRLHLDGFNFLPFLTGKEKESPRQEFHYFSDDGDFLAVRHNHTKVVFMEQRQPGTFAVWSEPFTSLRVPKIFNLYQDPYERSEETSNVFNAWQFDHVFYIAPAMEAGMKVLATFKDFPPRQVAATRSLETAMENARRAANQ